MHPRVAVLVLGACVAIATTSARADDAPMSPAAAALWQEGQGLYDAGKYNEAIERFERARGLEPRPEFLYAAGQAARKAGDCRRAIELYRRFIVESSTPARIEAARLQIARCEEDLAKTVPTPAQPPVEGATPAVTEKAPAATSRTAPPRSRVWYRDTLGVSLVVGTTFSVVAGSVFLVRSRQSLDDARGSYGEFENALDAQQRDRVLAISLLSAGAVLATGAVLRFTLWPARVEGRASVVVTPGSVTTAIEGRF